MFYRQFLITYIFSISLIFGACHIKGLWSEFRVRNATLYLRILFNIFMLFSSKKYTFLSFSFPFFYEVSNPQQNSNQSEIGTGDERLLKELYGRDNLVKYCSGSSYYDNFICLNKDISQI